MLALRKLKVEALKEPLLRQIGMSHRKQTQNSHKLKMFRMVYQMQLGEQLNTAMGWTVLEVIRKKMT